MERRTTTVSMEDMCTTMRFQQPCREDMLGVANNLKTKVLAIQGWEEIQTRNRFTKLVLGREVEGALGACRDKVIGCGLRQANLGMLVQIQQGSVVPLFTWVRLVLVLVSQVSVGEFQATNQVSGSMLQDVAIGLALNTGSFYQ
jgi:hypothetical protein